MQECDFENFYFVFYVQQIVAGQYIILSSKGLNHNLKIFPEAPRNLFTALNHLVPLFEEKTW